MSREGAGTLIVWVGYVWVKTLAGLAIHPYQSVRRMVFGDKILLPVALSPIFGLIGLFVLGRIGSFVVNVNGLWREFFAFVLGSTLVGLLLWQGLLVVLIYRFWRAR